MRFITHPNGIVGFSDQQEPDIVVFVSAFKQFSRRVAAFGNRVDIDIEREQRFVLEDKPELSDSRFFLGFAKRHLLNVDLTVGVTPQLEPAIEFAMVGQQDVLSIGRQDPGRAGEMTRLARPLKTIGPTFDQLANLFDHPLFVWVAVLVSVQEFE